eukprot:746521-Hanusia_phi.AAC.4
MRWDLSVEQATSDERMEQVSALSFEMETLRQQHRESLLLLRKYEKTIKILAQRAHVNNTQGAASQTLADVSSVMDSLVQGQLSLSSCLRSLTAELT